MVVLGRRRKIERLRLGERYGSGGSREKDAAKMAALRESAGTIYRAPTNLRQAGRCGERGGGPGPFVPQGELKSGAYIELRGHGMPCPYKCEARDLRRRFGGACLRRTTRKTSSPGDISYSCSRDNCRR